MTGNVWQRLVDRLLFRQPPIRERRELIEFISGNSSMVAQTTLYGYIKTRAGLQYFRMFDEPRFVASLNIAKWNIFAVSVGDLAAFCGAHLHRSGAQLPPEKLALFMRDCAEEVFANHGTPPDADEHYRTLIDESLAHIENASMTCDNEKGFLRSPAALVYWAPIADEHKKFDEYIVKNSITFKWKEVRAQFRERADVSSLEQAADGEQPSKAANAGA